jgi:hypothetical protein
VDGRQYTWEEFGEFLSSFNGFNFRLECFDACESVETTPDPIRVPLNTTMNLHVTIWVLLRAVSMIR